jgi:type IV secretion system protein VirD4
MQRVDNRRADSSDVAFACGVLGIAAVAGLLFAAAVVCAWLGGHRSPRFELRTIAKLLAHPSEPSAAFGPDVASAWLYWTTVTVLIVVLAAGAFGVWRLVKNWTRPSRGRLPTREGLATRQEAIVAAGERTVVKRGLAARPSVTTREAAAVGVHLGRSHGREMWASIEDSIVLLGPPRSGKGLHLVIPMILDAPGAVLTTSTRPDNLTATYTHRSKAGGPIGVFDPQGLAPGVESQLTWSPIRGCEIPQTAITRARALSAGMSSGLDGGDFWQAQTETVLQGMLHAAALDGRDAAELYRWSLDPSSASEAVRILNRAQGAGQGWADTLGATVTVDPRTRDSIWIGVRTALACLADPRVIKAVTPRDGTGLHPADFIAERGSLYLLGTSTGAGAAANLIAALVEDVVETAREQASVLPSARLDPPLALILDEVANYPLPSLPSLMSEGGGTGITTVAVLQSLAQARAKWGEHEGAAIWDSAIVKVILGGGSNARDLQDLSALIGDRDDETVSETRDRSGNRTYSTNLRRVPILDTGRLRTLPSGTAVLLLRSAPPIPLELRPWTARPDAADLTAWRSELEQQIRRNRKPPTPRPIVTSPPPPPPSTEA